MMAISESESVAYGGIKTGSPAQATQSPHEESAPDQTLSSMNKPNSIFSLTLDEIQLKSGKTFGSMNMDEFLANLWNVDENQAPSELNQNEPTNDKGIGGQPTLARQGSFSIPTPLCKKTVDEVWFEIQKELPQQRKANNITDHEPPQRQQTFGEMTLEDFLIKAGVVQDPSGSSQPKKVVPVQTNGTSLDANYGMGHLIGSSHQKMVTPIQNNNAALDPSFGMGHMMGLAFPGHQIVPNNLAPAGNGYAAAYPIFTQTKTIMGDSSNGAENGSGTNNLLEPACMIQNKKRIIDGPPEVVVERRQRRMIKNRESAARSRARKQAYTVELELELNQLKQENAKLKQLVEESEHKRKQEVMKRKQSTPAQRKVDRMRTLRRTVSLGW